MPQRPGFARRAARLAPAAVLALVPACAARLGPDLGLYDLPEDPSVAAAPWPRLVDVPVPPPPGQFTEAVPDPAEGAAIEARLAAEAARLRARSAELSAPVLTEAERRRLLRGREAPVASPRPRL